MLTERKPEPLALEYKLERALNRRIVLMSVLFALLNITIALVSVVVTLNLTHAIWNLRP